MVHLLLYGVTSNYNTITTQLQHNYNTITKQLQHNYNTITTQLQHNYNTIATQFATQFATNCGHNVKRYEADWSLIYQFKVGFLAFIIKVYMNRFLSSYVVGNIHNLLYYLHVMLAHKKYLIAIYTM